MRFFVLLLSLVMFAPLTAAQSVPEINWDDLMPKNWDPMRELKSLKLDQLTDADPRAMEALEKVRASWANAPVVPEVDGKRGRIAGYIVPLEKTREGLKEFLLVPYYGACIHVPPPPPNQVIHVTLSKPRKNFQTMDALWVTGTLKVQRMETGMGSAGYRMFADSLSSWKPH
jgi:hypothetical protein